MTKVGLVLGAGGKVGEAYHAGVLTALEHDLGWDPRTADVIVGTSAGSFVGAMLSLGVPASDLAANLVGAQVSPEGAEVLEPLRRAERPLPPLKVSEVLRGRWNRPSPHLLRSAVRRPWALSASRVAMTLVPDGRIDLLEHAAEVLATPVLNGSWPQALRICAARRSDARRIVFGASGAPPASLAEAVAASCAIPGYFAPVSIGGIRYIDGGVHSPTNAGVLRHAELDLVIVSSPMSAVPGRGRDQFRQAAHRQLTRETDALRKAGTTVVTFEPGRRSLAVVGTDALSADHATEIVQAAFFEAGRWASHRRTAPLLQPIAQW